MEMKALLLISSALKKRSNLFHSALLARSANVYRSSSIRIIRASKTRRVVLKSEGALRCPR